MCMITYLPRGVDVPEREILNGATWNDMGHGWAVIAEPGIILTGRFWNANAAVETFAATRAQYLDMPAVFHSRLATHGDVSLANIHPFNVGKFAVVAHNGILPSKFQPAKADSRSDTAILAQQYLPGWSETTGIWTRKQRRRIGKIIGHNKLVILSASPFLDEPKGWIVNQHMGEWHRGAWYSNSDYVSSWYSERRFSYTKSSVLGSSGWWDDDYATIGKKAIESAKILDREDECRICGAYGIDVAADYCTYCDSCQSCGLQTGVCLCYTPKSLTTKSEDESEHLA